MQNLNSKLKIQKILLILILLISFVLRVYRISEYPAGLNADEAAIGYNAFSLIETGKDEFGHSWPINFQSFNDFKPGLYFYLVLPFVKVLGLNELAVRLPSVIFGTLTVLIIYLFVKKLWDNQVLAEITAFLLAISPWHLHFSRGGWESNVATFFIALGIYLFFVSLEKPKIFAFCALSFALSMYTYHSARIIAPLLLVGLGIFYRKKIFTKKNFLHLSVTIFLSLLLLVPLTKSFLGQEGTSRFSGVGIFADKGPYWRVNELRGQHANPYSLLTKLIHTQYVEYGIQFFYNYLRHFNGDYLFISGDEIQRNRVPEMGQMYLVEFPLLTLGLYFLLKKRPKNWNFVIWWLMIAPVASALTFQSPHAIRSLNMVIPLVIIVSYGVFNLIDLVKSCLPKALPLLYLVIAVAFGWNFSFYLHQYYVHYPKTYPAAWEYGFKDLVSYVAENQNRFDKIYMTNKYDQPYILFAFYLEYSPSVFQKEAILSSRDQYGFSTVKNFSKFYFDAIDWNNEKFRSGRTMVIGTSEEIPDSATIVKRIYFKDGKTEAFRIVEN